MNTNVGNKFKKGESGNPAGRPPSEKNAIARAKKALPECVTGLAAIAVDRGQITTDRIAATRLLVEIAGIEGGNYASTN